MKPVLFLVVASLTAPAVLPDIAPNPRNRSALSLAPDQPTTAIAMRAEVVELTLHEDFAEVRAVFDMEHTGGEPESLEVGFPTEAIPLERSVREGVNFENTFTDTGGTIYAFAAAVDGEKVAFERKEVDDDDPRDVHRKWVCWPMTFAPGQKRRVEVRYEVETRDAMYLRPHTALQPREVFYVLKTGRGWKDVIGSARVLLRAADGFDLARVEAAEPAPTSKRDGEWEWHFEDFEPDADIRVRYRVYRDPQDAIARIERAGKDRELTAEAKLDLAENCAALGQHARAAELFGALIDQGEGPRRLPKAVFSRTYYRPLEFLRVRSLAAAGQTEQARELVAGAAGLLRDRLEDARRYMSERDPQRYERVRAEIVAMLEELAELGV